MAEEDIKSDIEWKQKKDDSAKEHNSRKLDMQKILEEDAKQKNVFKKHAKSVRNLPKDLKKLQKKVRTSLYYEDEDEDDEDNCLIFDFNQNNNSSLIKALSEDEKSKMLLEQDNENHRMQEMAGKMEAIIIADKDLKKIGLKNPSKIAISENIIDVTQSSEQYNKHIKDCIEKKTGVNMKDMSGKDAKNMYKGVVKVSKVAHSEDTNIKNVENKLSKEDLVHFGKEIDDKKVAEEILEKTGRSTSEKDKTAKETEKAVKAIKNKNSNPEKDNNYR